MTDIPISLELSHEPFPNIDMKKNGALYIKNSQMRSNISNTVKSNGIKPDKASVKGRKRSNSQSQVISLPTKPTKYTTAEPTPLPTKRNQIQYYVTLLPLNDTFIKKHLPVAIYPETTKLGRPTGTKHKPDITNGYFDSRVLSRNHAQIYIDSKSGKLMLQDLGSSNGTYLNDIRLGNDPVELKVGDVVCLGFNVQAESTHKQISLKIDKINVISSGSLSDDGFDSLVNHGLQYDELDSADFKHLSFIEDIYRQVTKEEQPKKKKSSKRDLTFDSALFGDINANIEDNLLGLYSTTNSGIYNNSQITNTTALENIISILVLNLFRVKQQNSSLNTIENFLNNYHSRLDTLNRNFLNEKFKSYLSRIEDDLTKERTNNDILRNKLTTVERESGEKLSSLADQLKSLEQEKHNLNESYKSQLQEYEMMKQDSMSRIEHLEQERDLLKQTLENEEKPEETEEITTDDVNTAINGFIMDLSRTPSVRETNRKKREVDNSDKVSIELTPPVSDDEKEEENTQAQDVQNSNSTLDLISAEISNTYSNDVEPFPKVHDQTHEEVVAVKKKFKLENEEFKQVRAIAIAISGVLIGYFIRRLTG